MCKKLLVAAVVVVAALVVIKYTGFGRHVRLLCKQGRDYVQSQIPEEQDIASLQMELEGLTGQDRKHQNVVAHQRVEVKAVQKDVDQLRERVATEKKRVLLLEASLEGNKDLVSYEGKDFPRKQVNDELMTSARRLQSEMRLLKAKEESLEAKRKELQVNEEKLDELKLMRVEMQTELDQLKLKLALDRQAAASEKKNLDDAGYRKLRGLINAARKRREVAEEERNIRAGATNPVRDHEMRKKQEEETREFLKSLKNQANGNAEKQ